MSRPKFILLQLCVSSLFWSTVSAQVPNPDLWEEQFNPSGDRVVPLLIYNDITGVLSIDTLGLNRVADTPHYPDFVGGPILGDDVGLVAVDLRAAPNAAGGVPFSPFHGEIFQGLAWSSNSTQGGTRYNLSGNSLGGNAFLLPGKYDWLLLPVGLAADDFYGGFPTSVALAFDTQGSYGFVDTIARGGVTVVPEPHLQAVLVACMAIILVIRSDYGRNR